MIFFNCDYNEGAHERIIKRLVETNLEQTTGYGEDDYCRQAAEMILEKCELPEGQVHFLVGGTQTNLTVIAACLKPWQGVISADTGHINCHETGAIEATGHKVLALPGRNGKLKGDQIREAIKAHREDGSHEHMVQPGMVYISNPTEIGTIYHQKSLEDLYNACQECGLYLYIDGARMGYGLMARDNDLTLPFIARHCDAFTLGGTKQGALFGEAVVITNPALGKDFRYLIKQRGGMLAKGRLLGIQFQELMKDDLYFELSVPPWWISAFRCPLAALQTSSLRSLRILNLAVWQENTAFPTGSGWMLPTVWCGSAPAGPPGKRTWTRS
mgnify:CR=1 FL=1